MQILRYCFLLYFIYLFSCSKEIIDTSSQYPLKFSTDTLTFDTVFQTLGSATRSFRIYNHSSSTLIISKTYLQSGSNSQFRFNIDGRSSFNAENIRILPNDSLWVFAEVTVNPNPNNPLLVMDSLVMEVNGSHQVVIFRAFGQNAYFHYGEILLSNTTFQNDKPHVILDKQTVNGYVPGIYIPQGITLNIQEGCQLHFGSSAGILVDGSLKVNGTKDKHIKMRGVRLEKEFIHAAGQWLGILVSRGSRNNIISYTSIDESAFGLWMGFQSETDFTKMTDASRAEIILKNSTISNGYYWNLRSFNCKISADNCQFYTSTDYMVQLLLGGEYQFRNCTLFNIQSEDKKSNLVFANQFYDDNSKQSYKNKLTAGSLFENCIINSNTDESIVLDIDESLNSLNDFQFLNCNYNSSSNLNPSNFIDCQLNKNPEFANTEIDKENLKLKSNSPCIDAGRNNGLSIDIVGEPRPKGSGYDIGAYEN